jgi:hypothetical protein
MLDMMQSLARCTHKLDKNGFRQNNSASNFTAPHSTNLKARYSQKPHKSESSEPQILLDSRSNSCNRSPASFAAHASTATTQEEEEEEEEQQEEEEEEEVLPP